MNLLKKFLYKVLKNETDTILLAEKHPEVIAFGDSNGPVIVVINKCLSKLSNVVFYTQGKAIFDPATGDYLGILEVVKAYGKVLETYPKYNISKVELTRIEKELAVGDKVKAI
jgi:hypothetical protein